MTPTILLIPGMSSIASVLYAPLVRELLKLGFADVLPLELPSVDATSRVKDLVPDPLTVDIQSIRAKIQALVDDGKEVVVAAHSYGGTPSLYASEGLWKHERQSKGLEGGVLKAVLISSSLSLPGTTIAGVRAEWAGKNMPELIAAQESSHVEIIDVIPFVFPDEFEKVFMVDMTADEQIEWAKKGLRPHALASMLTPAPEGNVSSWRIAYLITAEQDPAMPVPLQQWLIDNAKEAGAEIEEVKTLKSGHFVQITHAEEVASWISELSSS